MLEVLDIREEKFTENQKELSYITSKVLKLREMKDIVTQNLIKTFLYTRNRLTKSLVDERGDVPGWVLVVLMTTGLVTAIWAIAKPNLTSILNNSLNAMNGVR
jgi:hypothetical protein